MFLRGPFQVFLADDMIALPKTLRVLWPEIVMATLSGTPARTVADRAAPEIVEQALADLGCLAGGLPLFVKKFYLVGSVRIQKNERRYDPKFFPFLRGEF